MSLERKPAKDTLLELCLLERRLWFLHQVLPDKAVYNVPMAFLFQGNLDYQALEETINRIVLRHEVLRTRFHVVDGLAYRRIQPHSRVNIPFVTLQCEPPADPKPAINQVIQAEARTPFDLTRDSLFRVRLVFVRPDEHILLLTIHHIVFDGWSRAILLKELELFYNALISNTEPEIHPLPLQYTDFAANYRAALEPAVIAEEIAYWRESLKSVVPVLSLPFDHKRPQVRTHNGRTEAAIFSNDLLSDLQDFSASNSVSIFMTMLAAFEALLFRYTAERNIALGVPVAAREMPGTERLVGFFVNTIVLTCEIRAEMTFLQLLSEVKNKVLDGLSHKEVPFEKIIEELNPQRSSSYEPFTQIFFEYMPLPDLRLNLTGLDTKELLVDCGLSKFDLTFLTASTAQGLQVRIEYNTDLFEVSTIARMLKHFENILKSAVRTPDAAVSSLQMLDSEEWNLLVHEWNDTDTDYPRLSLQQLFEQTVQLHPNNIALRHDRQSVTYSELNRRANQIAYLLKTMGIGPGCTVAVVLNRSPDLIAAIAGVVKSGAAYLPADTSYPIERLEYILKDAGAKVLLTTPDLSRKVKSQIPKICFEQMQKKIARQPTTNPEIASNPSSLAYIMYTSGSTGRPKGVMVPHRAVARLICNTNYIQIDPSEVFAQASTIAFDAATFEIWGALLHGACLELMPRNLIYSPKEFGRWLKSQKITVMFLTPQLFRSIAEDDAGAFQRLRYLLLGGDKPDPVSVRHVLRTTPPMNLLNAYGPTETTTFACWFPIQHLDENEKSIPIGKPISNTKIYVLDAHLQPVPVGVYGEIYIGGPGLATGYLNAPELTRQKFVPNPFSGDPQSRLYKTGDIGRRMPNGDIQFIGRIDNQIKIRGFRIEPGEVQSNLQSHPSIRNAAVLVVEDSSSERSLRAFVVPGRGKTLTEADLRSFLRTKLPDYMIPAGFVFLRSLPLTANQKLDLAALESMEPSRPPQRSLEPPRDEYEMKILQMWHRLLKPRPIGVNDDFFDLGGHSLMLIRLFDMIEKEFNRQIPLAKFFESPTIETLASILRGHNALPAESLLLPVQITGTKPPFFLAAGVAVDLTDRLGPEQPVYLLLNRVILEKCDSIEQMAELYLNEIRKVCPDGPYFLGGFCQWGILVYEMAVRLYNEGKDVRLVLLESYVPNFVLPRRQKLREEQQKFVAGPVGKQWNLRTLIRRIRRTRQRFKQSIRNLYVQFDVEKKIKSYYLLFRTGAVPRHMRDHLAFREKFPGIAIKYIPKVYRGDVTLVFRTNCKLKPHETGWEPMLKGTARTQMVDFGIDIRHVDIFKEPFVGAIADILKGVFDSVPANSVASIDSPMLHAIREKNGSHPD